MDKLDSQKLFGLNMRGRTLEELSLLADSREILELLHNMYGEVTDEYIKTRYAFPVSEDVNNIKEKLDYARQIVTDRIFYTLLHLPELANAEFKKRRSLDKSL